MVSQFENFIWSMTVLNYFLIPSCHLKLIEITPKDLGFDISVNHFDKKQDSCAKVLCGISTCQLSNVSAAELNEMLELDLCSELVFFLDLKNGSFDDNWLKDNPIQPHMKILMTHKKKIPLVLNVIDPSNEISFLQILSSSELQDSFMAAVSNFLRKHSFMGLMISLSKPSKMKYTVEKETQVIEFIESYSRLCRANNWTFDISVNYPFESLIESSKFRKISIEIRYTIVVLKPNNKSGYGFPLRGNRFSVDDMMKEVEYSYGIDIDNVGVGLPLYASFVNLSQETTEDNSSALFNGSVLESGILEDISLENICEHLMTYDPKAFKIFKDNISNSVYLKKEDIFIHFEAPNSIKEKASHLFKMGVPAILITSLMYDDLKGFKCGSKFPILKSIRTAAQSYTGCPSFSKGIFIKSDSHQDDENLKIFVSAGVIGIVVLVSGLLVLIYRNGIRNLKRRNTQNQDESVPSFIRKLEICKSEYTLDPSSVIGDGQFSIVMEGTYKGKCVAVKLSKRRSENKKLHITQDNEIQFLEELRGHENIVHFLGFAIQKHSNNENDDIHIIHFLVFLELCPLGSLDTFLKKQRHTFVNYVSDGIFINRRKYTNPWKADSEADESIDVSTTISTKTLISWAFQICDAMEFISNKKIVHGDLAARNVLLKSIEQVKICDFGLSSKLNSQNATKIPSELKEPLPWRWMPVECLEKNIYSLTSDVWSYGVTVWEIFSLGEIPYAGLEWNSDFIGKLKQGLRLASPKYSSDDIYKTVMVSCWNSNFLERPSFAQLKGNIHQIISTIFSKGYADLTGYQAASNEKP